MTGPSAITGTVKEALPYATSKLNMSIKQGLGYDMKESFEYCSYEGIPCGDG